MVWSAQGHLTQIDQAVASTSSGSSSVSATDLAVPASMIAKASNFDTETVQIAERRPDRMHGLATPTQASDVVGASRLIGGT
jgi:hypothetical protein